MTRSARQRSAGAAAATTGRSPWRNRLVVGGLLAVVALVAALLMLNGGRSDAGAIATLETADFHSLAFSPTEPDVVFFGHHNGVLRSDDGGRTWRPLVERPGFDAMGMAVAQSGPRRTSTIYLTGHDVFQVSADAGKTWRPVSHDLPGTDIHGFAMSPDDPSRLFAFVVGHGLFQSADAGKTWRPLPGAAPGDVTALAVARGKPEALFVGTARNGILRTEGGSRRLLRATEGLGPGPVLALASDPSSPGTVYAGLDGGLYKTTDAGATWRKLPFPGSNAVALAVSPARPGTVLAVSVADRRGLVFRTEDGGATWGARD